MVQVEGEGALPSSFTIKTPPTDALWFSSSQTKCQSSATCWPVLPVFRGSCSGKSSAASFDSLTFTDLQPCPPAAMTLELSLELS